jgi:hypothetical protein
MNAPREAAIWITRAEFVLEQALSESRDGYDAIATVSLAVAMLRVAYGEMDGSELEGYPLPGEEDGSCTCPPELVLRGGFRGGCLVHATAA